MYLRQAGNVDFFCSEVNHHLHHAQFDLRPLGKLPLLLERELGEH